jgi:hypothetical protein
MAYEFVRITPTIPRSQFVMMAALPAAIAFLGGWANGGSSTAITWAVVAFLIFGFIWFFRHNKAVYDAILSAAKADLSTRGHNVDFQVGTAALIDSKSKIIAFVDFANKAYDLYSVRDILGWEHQWVNKTAANTNVWGTQASVNTRQANNTIVFKTNNPSKPLYKIPVSSHRDGEEWMARLGAIIYG